MGSVGWFNFSPFHLIVEKRSHPLQANDLARHNLGVSTSCYCWCFRNPTDFSTCYLWKPYKKWDTPLKTTIDTINCHLFKGVIFSTPSFWVSMLVFGSVVSISTAARFLNHQQYGNGKSFILHLSEKIHLNWCRIFLHQQQNSVYMLHVANLGEKRVELIFRNNI